MYLDEFSRWDGFWRNGYILLCEKKIGMEWSIFNSIQIEDLSVNIQFN